MKSKETAKAYAGLCSVLGHRFRRPLLEQALTHSSHAREQESRRALHDGRSPHLAVADNEQLEFLGDAVLGFVTSEELFQRFPDYPEGNLSKLRAHLVSASHLIRAANELQLGKCLRLGHGEEVSGGRSKSALLVNALEAVLAALYLDGGMEKARHFIRHKILEPELQRMLAQNGEQLPITDYKSALQEKSHALGYASPIYVLVKEEGPQHKKTFTVEARIFPEGKHGRVQAGGRSRAATKKAAEQAAAKLALEKLQASAAADARPRAAAHPGSGTSLRSR